MLNEKSLEELDVVGSEVMFAYNTCLHSTTGFTPYFLMFGVEARVTCEFLVGLPEMERTPAAYAFQRYQKLGVSYVTAGESADTGAKKGRITTIWVQFKSNSIWEIMCAYDWRH